MPDTCGKHGDLIDDDLTPLWPLVNWDFTGITGYYGIQWDVLWDVILGHFLLGKKNYLYGHVQ